MPFGYAIDAVASDMVSHAGAFGHSANNAVLCCWCGSATGAGTWDWLGRFRCHDCASSQRDSEEASRLLAVAAEVTERAAMWGLDA